MLLLIPVLILATAASATSDPTPPTCLDDDGNPVDWFIVYKLPPLKGQDYRYSGGASYAYITSADVETGTSSSEENFEKDDDDYEARTFLQSFRAMLLSHVDEYSPDIKGRAPHASLKKSGSLKWRLSKKMINDPNSLVMRTLAVVYDKKNSELNSLFYNDAPAETDDEDNIKSSNMLRAHAKGALIIDEVSKDSVWMTHSFPLFPPPRHMSLKFGENYRAKGQTVMCVNFKLNQAGDQVAKHLATMYPLVYDSYISDTLYETLPDLERLKKRRKKTDMAHQTQRIKTKGGFELTLFSKSAALGEDMYSHWMVDHLNTKLYVESWRNGGGTALNSTCPKDKHNVNNVQELKMLSDGVKLTWSYRVDHSKWAISENRETGLVCIGDINRMQSQFKRGGGAICFKCPSCWSVFSSLILEVEPCPVVKRG